MPDRAERIKANGEVNLPLSEAPYNVVAEMVMAVRYALKHGFLTGNLEENLAAITYQVEGAKKECLLVRDNGTEDKVERELWVRTTHDESSDVLRSHLYVLADLVAGEGQKMRMMAVMELAPVYLGGNVVEPQFGLEPESIIVRFSVGNTHFDFGFVDGGLVVAKSKGEKVIKKETLHCVDQWEKGGRQKLRAYLDPDIVDAPAVVWLRFFKKVLDGEVYEKNITKLKERISDLLAGETSRVKQILVAAEK